MRERWIPGLLGLALLSAATVASADQKIYRASIQSLYDRHAAAFSKKDLMAYTAVYTPDFTGKSPTGRVQNKQQRTAYWQRVFGDIKAVESVSMKIDKAEAKGDQVIATSHFVTKFDLADTGGRFGAKGKVHKVFYDAHFTDTWVKAGTSWQIKQSDELRGTKFTLDGKAPPPGPASKKA